jgi:hypothetical protein
MTSDRHTTAPPTSEIHVVEPGVRLRKNWTRCQIDRHIEFTTESLESYFFSGWKPLAYDALLLAGAIQFADSFQRRPALTWRRQISLRVPVSEPDRWNSEPVSGALHDAISFLTGDSWNIEFYPRNRPVEPPQKIPLSLGSDDVRAVIPFSNGMDSLAVAGLKSLEMGGALVRVRLGSREAKSEKRSRVRARYPFTAVPYRVNKEDYRFGESTARSRGFKYALVSGLAAYMANAGEVIVPESGQGALGPALLAVGQSYPDYRSHPLFTARMEKFLKALFGYQLRYSFPRLWNTKAETLREFIASAPDANEWLETWSCWQQNRHSSVAGKRRHCGVCAACMLRRLSVHAAGQAEPRVKYVWEDLTATEFERGAATDFDPRHITPAMHHYSIAGTLHLDHLADLQNSRTNMAPLRLHTYQLSRALGMPAVEAQEKMSRFLSQHRSEWKAFVNSLGKDSFVAEWAVGARS